MIHQAEISKRTLKMMRSVVSETFMIPFSSLPRIIFVSKLPITLYL